MIVVAGIVMYDVEVLKTLISWFAEEHYKQKKWGVPLSIIVGSFAAITLDKGIVSGMLQFMQRIFSFEYALSSSFYYFDIFSACLIFSKGSGYLINVLEKSRKDITDVYTDSQDKEL